MMDVDNMHMGFHLNECTSLLGHNGAGKSSIFRCMGGLWNIPHGTITKPGGASSSGLHQSIFYLVSAPIQHGLMTVCIALVLRHSDRVSRNITTHNQSATIPRVTYSWLPCLCAQPQKPYNVLGTLADQMTYPDEHAGELSREALFEVLEQVDLTYLLDRDGVMVSHTIDAQKWMPLKHT